MKRIYFLSLLVFSAPALFAQQGEVKLYSLQECITYALENNQNVKNAGLSVDMSRYKIGEIVSAGLPQINASADLGYNFKVQTAFLPAEIAGGEPGTFVPVQFSPPYSGNASINLNQMVFNGSYIVGLKASKTYSELASKEKIKSEIDVIEAVSKAYYLALVNQERSELIDKNYDRLDSLLRETTILHQNGFAEKIDVDRVKVNVNNIAVTKRNFTNTLNLSYSLLKFQMGLDPRDSIQLKDKIADVQLEVLDENFGSDSKIEDRIEMSILQTNMDLSKLDVKNVKAQYLPSLDLYGAIGATSGAGSSSELMNFGDNWFGLGVVGLRLSVPIFDGLYKTRVIQQKKLQTEQIVNTRDQLQKSITLEIDQAQAALQYSVDNLAAQRENMDLAEGIFNTTRIKFKEGVGSNIEVIDADASYKEAQANYYNALYDALVAKIELEKSYGKLTVPQTK